LLKKLQKSTRQGSFALLNKVIKGMGIVWIHLRKRVAPIQEEQKPVGTIQCQTKTVLNSAAGALLTLRSTPAWEISLIFQMPPKDNRCSNERLLSSPLETT